MREIKFRVWDKALGMYDPVCPEDGTLNEMLKEYDGELMQYTGLKDKNGKEIYGGDIASVNGVPKQIIWSDTYCGFRTKGDRASLANIPTLEVIGNIYENPELLK